MNGFISRIQRYSTKDGPGIRSTVFLVGCNLRCKWCSNPELLEVGLKIMYFEERCVQCGACVALSNGTISFSGNACRIDRERCTNLEECADACSYNAYEKIGIEISPERLYRKLKRDEPFYRSSGGGVTFSGGEACMQDAFVQETACLLRKDEIHTALETAGSIKWGKLEKLIECIDLILYDIKALDPGIHRRWTGVDNTLILENARRIAAAQKPLGVRMIRVPLLNDGLPEIRARLNFIKELGSAVQQVDILEYHNLGRGKYVRLGMKYPLEEISAKGNRAVEHALRLAQDLGLKTTRGG